MFVGSSKPSAAALLARITFGSVEFPQEQSCEEHSPSPSRKPMDEADIVTVEGMTNDSRRCESLQTGCRLHRRAVPRPAQHARIYDFSAILLTKP